MSNQQPSGSSAENINTGGGSYTHGNVNTGGGDFVGRDQIKYVGGGPPTASELESWLNTFQFDFSELVQERTHYFTGRDWVFDRISDWVAGGQQQTFMVTGDAGTGKTAIAARLVQSSQSAVGAVPLSKTGLPTAPFLAAVHFCTTSDSLSLDPQQIARALAAQLLSYPAYREVLLRSLPNPYSLNGANAVWNALVAQPLRALKSDPLIILIDSLDEAEEYRDENTREGRSENLVDLLARTPRLPAVRWLLTSRDREEILARFSNMKRLDLINDAEDSVKEVKQYALRRLEKLPVAVLSNDDRNSFALDVAERAEGKFLYARYVLDDKIPLLAKGEKPGSFNLPSGLPGIYREYLDRLAESPSNMAWRERLRPVTGLLAVAQVPLTLTQLATYSGLSLTAVQDALTDLETLVVRVAEDHYSFFHRSFVDFLLSKDAGSYGLLPADYHSKLAAGRQLRGRQWNARTDEYLVRFTPTHLVALLPSKEEVEDDLVGLLTDFGYLTERVRVEGGNTWPLERDYQLALGLLSGADSVQVAAFADALRSESQVLQARPDDLFVQLRNRLYRGDGSALDRALSAGAALITKVWLRALHPLPFDPALKRTLLGHTANVTSVDVTPDGRWAASAAGDLTIRMWDLQKGLLHRTFEVEEVPAMQVAISSNGSIVAGLRQDGIVHLWNTARPQQRTQITLNNHHKRQVRGTQSVAQADGTVLEWALVWPLITSIALIGDGRELIVATIDGAIVRFDLETGDELERWNSGDAPVVVVAATLDGRRIVSGNRHGLVHVWQPGVDGANFVLQAPVPQELLTGDYWPFLPSRVLEQLGLDFRRGSAAAPAVTGLDISDDGQLVVATYFPGLTVVWDLETQQRKEWQSNFQDSIALTRAGRAVIATGPIVLDLNTGEPVNRLRGHTGTVSAVAVTPDGHWIVSGGGDRTVRLWDLAIARQPRPKNGHGNRVTAVALSPDGLSAATAAYGDNAVLIWDTRTGKVVRSLKWKAETGDTRSWGSTEPELLAWTDMGNKLVTMTRAGSGQRWNLGSGVVEKEWHVADGIAADRIVEIQPLAAFGGNRLLLRGGTKPEGRLQVYDIDKGQVVYTSPNILPPARPEPSEDDYALATGASDSIISAAVTPDGVLALAGTEDGLALLVDLSGHNEPHSLEGLGQRISTVAIAPNRRQGLGSDINGLICVWNLDTGTLVHKWTAHKAYVHALAVSPDEQLVLAGGWDGTLRLWDLESGAQLAHYSGVRPFEFGALAMAGQDLIAAVGDADGNMFFFAVDGLN